MNDVLQNELGVYDRVCRNRFETIESTLIGIVGSVGQVKERLFNGLSDDLRDVKKAVESIIDDNKQKQEKKIDDHKYVWKTLVFGIGGSIVVGVIVHLILTHSI